ncbi:hypothetical protein Y1Q_0008857 [Alligator mississippiensis]|uniref:Uncharacterized protein n=1 Tax=Alligator mississippiensis TaxID=8496 RepID=A0A151NAC7_ALLMI|nr:hypothetical protein Y1Q_0008857 [Alligator mississippiensis]
MKLIQKNKTKEMTDEITNIMMWFVTEITNIIYPAIIQYEERKIAERDMRDEEANAKKFFEDIINGLLSNILPATTSTSSSTENKMELAEFDLIHMKVISKVMAKISEDLDAEKTLLLNSATRKILHAFQVLLSKHQMSVNRHISERESLHTEDSWAMGDLFHSACTSTVKHSDSDILFAET